MTSRFVSRPQVWAFAAGLLASSASMAAQVNLTVTVENFAPENSVTFAPLRVGFHSGIFDSFDLGGVASPEIQAIAEGGSDALWRPAFEAADPDAVVGSILPGPLLPGQTATTTFTIDTELNPYFSFAAMVVPSKDFFIGNDDPTAYRLFDDDGVLQIDHIAQYGRDIWDAGSEQFDPTAAAFIEGSTNANRTDQNSVVAFNFAEFYAYNGLTTAAGYTFDAQLEGATPIYGISFAIAPVPEPETYAMMLAGLGLMGTIARRRMRK